MTRRDSAILVAATSAEDSFVAPGGTDPAEAARQSKFVALRDVPTHFSRGLWALLILGGIGLVVGGYEAYEHRHDLGL